MKYELIYRRSFVALSTLLFVGAKKKRLVVATSLFVRN